MIYEPSDDTFLLAEQVKKLVQGKVLDLGTGSGYLAEIAIKNNCQVLAADINKECVTYCNNKGIKTIQSDLFSNIKDKFDYIIFNPPYLPEDKDEDEESKLVTTGGKNGNEIIIKFFKQVKSHLNPNGKILILVSSLTPDAEQILKSNDLKYKELSNKKLFFEELKVYLIWQ
jgi:release factor glutamine methyltransferase